MKAYIVLENGEIFEGTRIGAQNDVCGELVFSTTAGGYIETVTDPSYFGQIVVGTFPLMGNYGIIEDDLESDKPALAAFVTSSVCETPSNFRCDGTLESYLEKQGIVALCGVDTRRITTIIRENGVMNAKIVSDLKDAGVDEIKTYSIKDAVKSVSTKEPAVFKAEGEKKFNVALLDLGVKRSLIKSLCTLGCDVTVFPFNTGADELLKYDGVVISEGPGDPSDNAEVIKTVGEIFGKKPIFAAGLGHQLMALSAGGKVEKLKYGHRGGSQPVKDLNKNRVYITNQNHGFAVDAESLPGFAVVTHVNANDGTCEGISYPNHSAFSVQFSPNRETLNRFITLMEVSSCR